MQTNQGGGEILTRPHPYFTDISIPPSERVVVVDCSKPERFVVQGREMDGLWLNEHSHSQQVWGLQPSDNA